MTYAVKEIFYTLQGEGANTGRPAVFCRFCDTDFVGTDGPGGGRFETASELARAVAARWPDTNGRPGRRFTVCTGGEPLLQMDGELVDALHREGFEIAVETNGTAEAPPGIDWICVSPKAGAPLVLERGDELKLVFPQEGAEPERFAGLAFREFFLQPMDGPDLERNTRRALEYCLEHPTWRLSLQTHNMLGIP